MGVDEGGDADASIPGISTEALGATLLTLGDVDPDQHLRTPTPPIAGLLK